MGITKLVQNKRFKRLLARLYGFGASVVILGALFKIEHWTGAGFMLSAGLITEAIIFIFYAFDTEEEPEPDSSEVKKPADEIDDHLISVRGIQQDSLGGNGSSLALAKFDEMLERADITPDLLLKLGTGMKKLGETAVNMNSMGDVSSASIKYINTIRVADESLDNLAKTYQTTIIKVIDKTKIKYKNISDSLSVIESGVKSYHQQMESLNESLIALNSMYKQQRKGADDYLKDIIESAEETKKYHEHIKKLNENISALNNFYGNMLSAMKVK